MSRPRYDTPEYTTRSTLDVINTLIEGPSPATLVLVDGARVSGTLFAYEFTPGSVLCVVIRNDDGSTHRVRVESIAQVVPAAKPA